MNDSLELIDLISEMKVNSEHGSESILDIVVVARCDAGELAQW